MDRRSALEWLGLEAGEPLTHDRLRRAYLRRLRAHPPERDPDGFRRLREAFEQLEPWARMQDHIRAAAAERAQSSDEANDEANDEADEPAPAIAVELDDGQRVEIPPATRVPPMAWAWHSEQAEAPASPPGTASTAGPDTPDEPPRRPSVRPVSAPIADPTATLRGVTDEILALFQTGKLDAALGVADRWSRSTLDDHREVLPHDAQRWALTRELLDVAPVLPDSLRRAIARGIATDDLATACAAAESYQALYPVQANDLARHLAKRATNIHKVLGRQLQSHVGLRDTPQQSSRRSSRTQIWVAVVIVSALLRAAGSCEQNSHKPDSLEPMPTLQWNGHAPPQLDPQGNLRLDPQRDPELDLRRLDLHRHPPAGELGSKQMLELQPEALIPPSRP